MALKPIARAAHALGRPIFKQYGLSEGLIAEKWTEIVGEEWAKGTAPRHYARQSRTLTVRVGGGEGARVRPPRTRARRRINTFAGREIVTRIKLVQGPLGRRPGGAGRGRACRRTRRPPSSIRPRPLGMGRFAQP